MLLTNIITSPASLRLSTPAANHLTPQNNVGSVAVFGTRAARFVAASEQALVIPSNNSLKIHNGSGYAEAQHSFTIASWVRFNSLTGLPQIFAGKDDNEFQ